MSRGHNVLIGSRLGAFACGLWLGLAGCAHSSGPAAPSAASVLDVRLTQLEQRLGEREQLVTQLESRLSLLEAEQRQLRYALAEREAAPVGVRETVRIGEAASAREERQAERKSEPRPVLRLYENRRPSETFREAELEPIPQVSERLTVAPLPESLGLGRASSTAAASDAQDPYLAAIDLVRRRDFPAALGALGAFLRDFPSDPRAGRALFWRGEVLFAQKDYRPSRPHSSASRAARKPPIRC